MRKITALILLAAILLSVTPVAAYGQENTTDIIYFNDGSYLTIAINDTYTRASGTKTAGKTYQYTDSEGVVAWKIQLTGSFAYTGSTSTCTSSSCNVSIYNAGWYVISKSASKSGASAIGDVTMGFKILGITTKKVPVSMTLTCDANGNLS